MTRKIPVAVLYGLILSVVARGQRGNAPIVAPVIVAPAGSGAVEQTTEGTKPAAALVASVDGLGAGFEGPQGSFRGGNPSDNSLAVGPDHIVQTVNSRMAIFTKKGKKFDATGRVLYGPVNTNNVFRGFGGTCETLNNGDAVVRYDQLAERWLIVMPIFRRGAVRSDQPGEWKGDGTVYVSPIGRPNQPGPAAPLFQPPPPPPPDPNAPPLQRGQGPGRGAQPPQPQGPYSMCYAVSTGADPMGSYYRYEFLRPLFPDYPRPAVWPDGYYIPTSTGDNRISDTIATQKHACVVERARMLKGEPASEQCVVIENVNFLNNADLDGKTLPPSGAPNVMMAAGGTQLDKILEDRIINVWRFHVDWKTPSKTTVTGPERIEVAPYRYLCDGQLTNCVPQPGTDRRLDAQGDKIMARLVYRRVTGARQRAREPGPPPRGFGAVGWEGAERGQGAPASDRAEVRGGAPSEYESIVAVHSVNTTAGGGGVRWYEFRIDRNRRVTLAQQGTYAPGGFFRWMASPAIDKNGSIGIGYSFGSATHYAGQRFAGRLANDARGQLTLRETVLVEGEGFQTAMRWQDYTQTAIDPSDDCTIWYVGDYIKKDATTYSSKIGAFRLPGCS